MIDKMTSIELKRWDNEVVVVPTCRGCGEVLDPYPFTGSHKEESLQREIKKAIDHHDVCKNPVEL